MADDNGTDIPDDENDAPPAPPSWTPPASQEELNKLIAARVARVEKKYSDYDSLKEAAGRARALEEELATDTEKAVKAARDEERAKVTSEVTPRLVRTAFRAEAKGVLDKAALDELLEDVDLSRFIKDGEVDEEKIAKKIAALAPKKSADEGDKFPDLGGGKRGKAANSQNMNEIVRDLMTGGRR